MPGNIHPANPSFVMPCGLAAAFEEVMFMDAMLNEFADGRSIRRALAINPRHVFRLSRRLNDVELEDLRGFYLANDRLVASGAPFWFYNCRETLPLFSCDPSGADPLGRYTVVWEGGFNETLGLFLHQSNIVLREVA